MTQREIAVFLEVYKHRSVSKAAQAMFLSQPTLSTQLNSLEQALGVPLFVRGKGQRQLSPTQAGEDLYPLALRYRELTEEILAVGRRRERLRISCVGSLGTSLISPTCAMFMGKMPNVEIELHEMNTPQAYVGLEQGTTDLALTPGLRGSRTVVAKPLFTEDIIFICAPGSDYPATVSLSDLSCRKEIYINWTKEFVAWHSDQFGPEGNVGVRMAFANQVGNFLRQPGMWCLMPATTVHAFEGVEFETRRTDFSVPPRVTYCLQRKESLNDPVAECFLSSIRHVLSQHNGECIICEK